MDPAALPPVVVAYGAADVPESWQPVTDALGDASRVLVPRRSTAVDPVAQLVAVIEEQPAPPIVVGHSYGGLLARLAVAHARRPVAGLVLVDATSARAARSLPARAALGTSTLGLRVAAPVARSGLGRLLLSRDRVRFVGGQRELLDTLGTERYEIWRDAIGRGIADGTAAAELAAVIPTASRAAGLDLSDVPTAVVHSRSLTRRLERPPRATTRRIAHVTDTRDRFHNIHLVHPDAVVAAVRVVAEANMGTPAAAAPAVACGRRD